MKLKMILAVLALGTSLCHAAPAANCAAQFKAEAKLIPQALIKKGYRQFGPLSMAEAVRHADRFRVVPDNKLMDGKDWRTTARWDHAEDGTPRVRIDCGWYRKADKRVRSMLGFHEVLWSMGIYDENYAVSIVGWLLTVPAMQQVFRADEIKTFPGWIGEIAVRSGGVVGVGGGGEVESIASKVNSLGVAMSDILKAKTEAERDKGLQFFEFILLRNTNFLSGRRMDQVYPR